MKITIVGNAGSGKSNLGLKLHNILKLPLYHLDQYFWKPGWQESNYTEFEKIHNKLCDQDEWIIEGMNTRILEYRVKSADIIIFLDFPRYLCFYRVFKRAITCFGKVYFSSAKGCPEGYLSFKFLKFIWNFPYKQKTRIESLIKKYKNQKKIFIIKNQTDLHKLIETLST